MSKKEAPAPWAEAHFTEAELAAVQALNAGVASKDQQITAINWIIYKLCRTYDQPYRPGQNGDRDTVFACAKQYCGQQIVKMTKLVLPPKKRQ